MLRDVNEEILLLKRLDDAGEHDGHDLQRRGRDALLRDEDSRVEIMLADVLREGAHLLDADGSFGAEFDPDGTDGGGWVRGRGSGQRGVYFSIMAVVGLKEVVIFLRSGPPRTSEKRERNSSRVMVFSSSASS